MLYTYRCICECEFQMEIRLPREIDFEVQCVRTGCDLIMEPILESMLDDNNGQRLLCFMQEKCGGKAK